MKKFNIFTLALLIGLMAFNCSKKPEPVQEEISTQVSESNDGLTITEENALEEADKLLEELENL